MEVFGEIGVLWKMNREDRDEREYRDEKTEREICDEERENEN